MLQQGVCRSGFWRLLRLCWEDGGQGFVEAARFCCCVRTVDLRGIRKVPCWGGGRGGGQRRGHVLTREMCAGQCERHKRNSQDKSKSGAGGKEGPGERKFRKCVPKRFVRFDLHAQQPEVDRQISWIP